MTMCRHGRLVIAVHDSTAPTDAEWDRWIETWGAATTKTLDLTTEEREVLLTELPRLRKE